MRPTVLHADRFSLMPPLAAGRGTEVRSAPLDGLWTVSGIPSGILRLAPGQLADIGTRSPATSLSTTSARLYALTGVAFDDAGNLWVASQDDSSLVAFAPRALASSGSTPGRTVIRTKAGSLSGPTGLAFDAHRRLWVVNNQGGTLVRFDPAQLAAGGPQAAAAVLTLPGSPSSLAFDAGGSLWVSDNRRSVITMYPAAQLAISGSPVPAATLTATDSLSNPVGMAFDAAGNLWVANTGNDTVAAFAPAQLASGGAAEPHVVLSSSRGSLDLPVGLAFDDGGSLWVVGGTGALTKFAAASLRASGAPAPSARLQIGGHTLFWSVALWPKPAGLPLR